MRRLAGLLALALAGPVAAADAGTAAVAPMAAMTREMWAKPGVAKMTTVQEVWTRTVSFDLPKPFVPAWRNAAPGSFMMEYVPDGESVQRWTRMITVTGGLGAGAARIDDETLANVVFDRGSCADRVYRDLGATAQPPLPYRTVVIGCGAEGAADSERAVIAVFRDDENMWTVQYAERGAATVGFEAQAIAKLRRLAPLLTCRKGDTGPGCSGARP